MSDTRLIAAGVIRQAVHDLEHAYKKVRHWDRLSGEYMLRSYIKKKVKQNNIEAVTFTYDDATAVDFFNVDEEANDKHCIMFGITGVEGLPPEIAKQKDYIEKNLGRLKKEIKSILVRIKREVKDEEEGLI